mgnify:CR=1 FL=1|jgi:hypothetical protein
MPGMGLADKAVFGLSEAIRTGSGVAGPGISLEKLENCFVNTLVCCISFYSCYNKDTSNEFLGTDFTRYR